MWNLKPPCLFYNLFACSNARYTSSKYYGGVYIFCTGGKGLIAIGSTKTGAMLYFNDYYASLGRRKCFGEAYKYWFSRRYPYSLSDRRWFYGMTLLGDPTLRIDRALLRASARMIKPAGGTVKFSIEGRKDNAGKYYVLLGSLSGSYPGMLLPGLRVPMNFDTLSRLFITMANTPSFQNSFGILDSSGNSWAKLVCGKIPDVLRGRFLTFSTIVVDVNAGKFVIATPKTTIYLSKY